MARASGRTLAFDLAAVPVLDGALSLAAANTPGGARTNVDHFGPLVEVADTVTDVLRLLAYDPQTSGGLLLAVDPGATGHLLGRLVSADVTAAVIGRVEPRAASGALVRLL
jgi:selenide,water dikinase